MPHLSIPPYLPFFFSCLSHPRYQIYPLYPTYAIYPIDLIYPVLMQGRTRKANRRVPYPLSILSTLSIISILFYLPLPPYGETDAKGR